MFFDSFNLFGSAGRISILMDVNWFSVNLATRDAAIENIEIFLERGVRIPEPGTLALFGLSLVGLGFSQRRRRTN